MWCVSSRPHLLISFACSRFLSCPAPPCCVVRCVVCVLPCWRAVRCGGSLSGLVPCCAALFSVAPFFFFCSLCAVLFVAVLCFLVVRCMRCRSCVLLSVVLLGCVLLCFVAVLYCLALCGAGVVVWAVSVLWCLVLWCASLCCGVFSCGACVVRCAVSCASSGSALLCPVALLVVCWAVPPCVVFGGASCAVLFAVLGSLRCVGLWCVPLSFCRWLVSGIAPCFHVPFCVGLGCFCPFLLPAAVFWWRVLSPGSLSGRLVYCAVVCCGSSRCPVSLCCVLWRLVSL